MIQKQQEQDRVTQAKKTEQEITEKQRKERIEQERKETVQQLEKQRLAREAREHESKQSSQINVPPRHKEPEIKSVELQEARQHYVTKEA
jgi:hypothetical protein